MGGGHEDQRQREMIKSCYKRNPAEILDMHITSHREKEDPLFMNYSTKTLCLIV